MLKILIMKSYLVFNKLFNRALEIDFKSKVHPHIYMNIKSNSNNKTIIIGSELYGNVRLGKNTKIVNAICSGEITIGNFVSINGPGTRISSRMNGVKIGNFCSLASNVIIQEDFHRINGITTYPINKNIFDTKDFATDNFSKGSVYIEDDVWIGSNVVILSGVTVGRGSIIGAGSIVTKSIPRYSIAAGNPCRVIRERFSKDIIEVLENSNWWSKDVEWLKNKKDIFVLDLKVTTAADLEKAIMMGAEEY